MECILPKVGYQVPGPMLTQEECVEYSDPSHPLAKAFYGKAMRLEDGSVLNLSDVDTALSLYYMISSAEPEQMAALRTFSDMLFNLIKEPPASTSTSRHLPFRGGLIAHCLNETLLYKEILSQPALEVLIANETPYETVYDHVEGVLTAQAAVAEKSELDPGLTLGEQAAMEAAKLRRGISTAASRLHAYAECHAAVAHDYSDNSDEWIQFAITKSKKGSFFKKASYSKSANNPVTNFRQLAQKKIEFDEAVDALSDEQKEKFLELAHEFDYIGDYVKKKCDCRNLTAHFGEFGISPVLEAWVGFQSLMHKGSWSPNVRRDAESGLRKYNHYGETSTQLATLQLETDSGVLEELIADFQYKTESTKPVEVPEDATKIEKAEAKSLKVVYEFVKSSGWTSSRVLVAKGHSQDDVEALVEAGVLQRFYVDTPAHQLNGLEQVIAPDGHDLCKTFRYDETLGKWISHYIFQRHSDWRKPDEVTFSESKPFVVNQAYAFEGNTTLDWEAGEASFRGSPVAYKKRKNHLMHGVLSKRMLKEILDEVHALHPGVRLVREETEAILLRSVKYHMGLHGYETKKDGYPRNLLNRNHILGIRSSDFIDGQLPSELAAKVSPDLVGLFVADHQSERIETIIDNANPDELRELYQTRPGFEDIQAVLSMVASSGPMEISDLFDSLLKIAQ